MTLESSLHPTYKLNIDIFPVFNYINVCNGTCNVSHYVKKKYYYSLYVLSVLVVHFGGVATCMVESNGEEWGTGQSFGQYTCFNTLADHIIL